ncbi:branched-chain amino acid transaminase [Acidobacteria bacterium ACD]|nr:MAG: branched-chain amino acid transaminase [Acidobacteriota bacterium]MCE7958295.1 branched-chain amino acid transaminase [Acidobacteria bacterium ACB2]MDL1951159.1 branched-chain amino acid transaminase [Acidobacteria bacterium ACD]
MSFQNVRKIWMNGKLVDFADAKVHVFTHALHYGSGVFEGIRCYDTARGPEVFRLDEHLDRLFWSAKIYRMQIPHPVEELKEAVLETIRANGFRACYIRPLAYRGFGALGVNPLNNPVDVVVGCYEWGKYLGAEAIEEGVDVCVSSWTRIAANTLPAMAKTTANYANSQLIKMEAIVNGYHEGIALDDNGRVSEGSGENLFVVWKGKLLTPPLSDSTLPGITRLTVLQLARELEVPIEEKTLPREILYAADEAFFTGTAAEITPIRSVDRIPVGAGRRGPVTAQLQRAFFDVVEGRSPDRFGWLTPVLAPVKAQA